MTILYGETRTGNFFVHNLHTKSTYQTLTIKIAFSKKLRADLSQEILAIIRCKIFCLPVCQPKIQRFRYI